MSLWQDKMAQWGAVPNIKEDWNSKVPLFRHKAQALMNTGNQNTVENTTPRISNTAPAVSTVGSAASGILATPQLIYTGSTPKLNTQSPTSSPPSSGNSIVDAAKKYEGTPYVWGGDKESSGGLDCSGFVYNALKDAGYNVGRTTAEGYRKNGTDVAKSDLQPGDLVFYGGKTASHIGIYVGDGQIMHSSGGKSNTKSNPGKGVMYSNINYRDDYIGAKRYQKE